MKIYAAKRRDLLDSLVGTDKWIFVRADLVTLSMYCWIRIISSYIDCDDIKHYTINYISASRFSDEAELISRMRDFNGTVYKQILKNAYAINDDSIEVQYPIRMLATSELFGEGWE